MLVHFCNHSDKGGFGMHPHGFRRDKDNEGAHYQGVQSGQHAGAGSQIAPGECFTYNWRVDRESAPVLGDPGSTVWWCHSHIDEPAETKLGLPGPIIITRKGMARSDDSPRDVDLPENLISDFTELIGLPLLPSLPALRRRLIERLIRKLVLAPRLLPRARSNPCRIAGPDPACASV